MFGIETDVLFPRINHLKITFLSVYSPNTFTEFLFLFPEKASFVFIYFIGTVFLSRSNESRLRPHGYMKEEQNSLFLWTLEEISNCEHRDPMEFI
jgi:hypothetical protein